LVIGVNEVATVIRYAAGGDSLGGNGFAEPGAGGGIELQIQWCYERGYLNS
jgi:hypothetical protein